ncbi:MAG: HAD-IA family hydrolase [Xanthomonadaceae bacterium]|nr:HAD-IA family hydrolase [Xanthomonadaceae bacterium]
MQEIQRLVLFDIDGTLLHGGSLWAGSFVRSVETFFPGKEIPKLKFNGKTDYQIIGECLDHWGIPEDSREEVSDQVLDHYLNLVEKSVRSGNHHEIEVLSGAVGLLNRLNKDPRVRLGILTGNVLRGANLKLKFAELENYFEFKITGDDHSDRYQMPKIAQERAKSIGLGEYTGKEIVIIGDTIHDVNCGKSIGVRSIAVGTGRGVKSEELLEHSPDYFFTDLSEIDSVCKAIVEEMR